MKLKIIIAAGLVSTVAIQSFINYSADPIDNEMAMQPKLSGYHIFKGNASKLLPAKGFSLYELATTLFSDYAEKQRLIYIPAGTSMKAIDDGLPDFPDGTILVKTFFYYNNKRDTSLGKRIIETRLLIKAHSTWNAATYQWNQEQTDATLLTSGTTIDVNSVYEEGQNRNIAYHIPANRECASCHRSNNAFVPIGPKIRNLNINVNRNNQQVNQLSLFQNISLISALDASSFTALPNWQNSSNTLEQRARAYLDVNCAHCHNKNGFCASVKYYPSYELPFEQTHIGDKKKLIVRMMKHKRMPLLGTTVIHKEGLALVEAYIKSLQ